MILNSGHNLLYHTVTEIILLLLEIVNEDVEDINITKKGKFNFVFIRPPAS